MFLTGQGDQMVVPVIATTNRRLALDPAFRSRFGIEHYVGLPNEVSKNAHVCKAKTKICLSQNLL